MRRRSLLVLLLWIVGPLGVLLGASLVIPAPAPLPESPFAISAEAPPALRSGEDARLLVAVRKRASGAYGGVIVDIEVYQGDRMVFQRFFEGQRFDLANEPGPFAVQWTPPAAGDYVLKAGVFNADWTKRYQWADRVATLKVK